MWVARSTMRQVFFLGVSNSATRLAIALIVE